MESCRNDTSLVPQQIADRVQEFRLLTVAHPLLLAVKDLLAAAINEAPAGSIVMVFGPTGVGKTTLRLKVQQLLSEQSEPFMATEPSRLPFVAVEAAAPDNGTFSWRDHYRRTLVELSEPMLDCKLKPKWIHFAHDSQGQQLVRPDASAAQLRQALESAVQHRRPAAILIDEAQHLTRMASGRRLADQACRRHHEEAVNLFPRPFVRRRGSGFWSARVVGEAAGVGEGPLARAKARTGIEDANW